MIAYLDTSSLVKLYVDEPDSEKIRQLVGAADSVTTSSIAYAEARATFARRRRERLMSARTCADLVDAFEFDWSRIVVITLTAEIAAAAGRLADAHDVRGCDAVHLASFEWLLARSGSDDVEFSCADARLTKVARAIR